MDSCKLDTGPTLAAKCLTSSLRVTCIIRPYFKLALNIDLKAMDGIYVFVYDMSYIMSIY